MSLRMRLGLQFAGALLLALGLQTALMIAMTERTVSTIAVALGGKVDSDLVTTLLARWQTTQWMYAALNATLIIAAWLWVVERTLLRPLKRLEADLHRFTVDEFVARLAGQSDLQRVAQGITRMMSQLKTTEAQLTRAEQLALVGRLSAGLAHEIGNPLGAVIGYVALIADEPEKNARKDLAERADKELQRINGLVRELLDYARPAPLKLERVQVAMVVKAAAALLSHQPRGRDIKVELDVAEDLFINADAARMQQVLLNIFLNAADAMNQKGTLSVRASNGVVIEVRDQGPGFSEEALDHAGEPFFTTKGPSKGSGLGLAVCQTLVKQQGGTLSLRNDGGAVVRMTLPRA
jgi:signal transduction histidine kinase